MTGRAAVWATVCAALVMIAGHWTAPPRADGSCLLAVTYQGAPYVGVGPPLPASADAGPVGPATIPACLDTVVIPPNPGIPQDPGPSTFTVNRLRGVAPRLAVIHPATGGGRLLLAEGSPCFGTPVAATVSCLRARTRALLAGPSLIAPPSAVSGSTISMAVRVRDPQRRKNVTLGIDSLLQRAEGSGWRSLYHLLYALPAGELPAPVPVAAPGFAVVQIGFGAGSARAVRLPAVEPGRYRLAQRVAVGGRSRWLFAPLTVLPVPVPACTSCPHG